MLYSPSTGGFYTPNLNTNIPEDSVEVDADTYQFFFDNQAKGNSQSFNAKTKKFVVKKEKK